MNYSNTNDLFQVYLKILGTVSSFYFFYKEICEKNEKE